MSRLFNVRFEIFFVSMMLILFGSLLVPGQVFQNILMPILFIVNIGSGILMGSKNKFLIKYFIVLLVIALITFVLNIASPNSNLAFQLISLAVYFVFYVSITIEIVKQILRATLVNKTVIYGLMSGYVTLGLIAFFIFFTIELISPGSYHGVLIGQNGHNVDADTLLYYSYVTLLTIGYGDIMPVTQTAQKVSVLVGLVGQFYIVIIISIVVNKYATHFAKK